MERNWYWRLLLVLGLTVVAIYYSTPSALYFAAPPDVRRDEAKLNDLIPDFLPDKRMNLGIDLQGGLHLVMGVDTEKAVQDRANRVGDTLVEEMAEEGKSLRSVRRPGDAPVLEVLLSSTDDWPKLKEILEQRGDTWEVRSHAGDTVIYAMNQTHEENIRDDAVAQALKTLRNRIDTYGVKEPEVRRRGSNSILIQIAGLTAGQEKSVKEEIIGKTAQLQFKIVDDTSTYFADIAGKPDKPESVTLTAETYAGKDDALITRQYLQSKDKQALRSFIEKYSPNKMGLTDRVVRIEEFRANRTDPDDVLFRTWLLERRTPLTGDALVDAFVAFDSDQNNYYVAMNFDRKGGVIFEKLTRNNIKRKMAIVLDDTVDSAPIIEGAIPNGRARITLGGFKSQNEILEDAKSLSIVLKAGALPAPVYPQEERTVGATLGDDAVSKGKLALLVAGIVIGIVMLIYYRISGAAGLLATGVNMVCLVAALSAFEATLTLPGIAGLALTIGMAVDANIIQFERIREELRLGKTARAAVDAGFDKAFSAIFDANVTTLLAAIVLLQYGSGPIRGFATTLSVGVVINTFTAVIIPRLCLDYLTRGRRVQELSI